MTASRFISCRYHALYGDQWTKIGKLLGRSGNSVNHKVLTLQKSTPGLSAVGFFDVLLAVTSNLENPFPDTMIGTNCIILLSFNYSNPKTSR